MNEKQRLELLENAKTFFNEKIVKSHISNTLKAGSLSDYTINPFLYKYLANFLSGDDSSINIARALILPRILGQSITTSFGMNIQLLISTLFKGLGSTTEGIDIEFVDGIDGHKKYCQLKAGPNTINSSDVETINSHFNKVLRTSRTNNLRIPKEDMIVGVIYGDESELSSHYKKIKDNFPVIIGKTFWHRLTNKEDFYFDLIEAFGQVAIEVDGRSIIEKTINKLADEIDRKLN